MLFITTARKNAVGKYCQESQVTLPRQNRMRDSQWDQFSYQRDFSRPITHKVIVCLHPIRGSESKRYDRMQTTRPTPFSYNVHESSKKFSKLDVKHERKSVQIKNFKESLKEAGPTKQDFTPGASHLLYLGSLDV